MVGITWYEALAFTRWLTERWQSKGLITKKLTVQLPSEAEWEKAAQGGLKIPKMVHIRQVSQLAQKEIEIIDSSNPKSEYPWGNEEDINLANYSDTGIGTTTAVGCFEKGKSPYGCEDMSGNVWEWTRSLWGKKFSKPEFIYPYNPKDGREGLHADKNMLQVLRGGSFAFVGLFRLVRCSSRFNHNSSGLTIFIGFRVILSPKCLTS